MNVDYYSGVQDERRGSPRYSISVPLHLQGLTARGKEVSADIEVTDFSLTGMGFTSTQSFVKGDVLFVAMLGSSYSSDGNLEIVWNDNPRHRYGAKILTLSLAPLDSET